MAQGGADDYVSPYTPLGENGNSSIPSPSPATITENIDDDLLFDDGESDYDANGLPYPKPIQRSSFSTPVNFDPDAFLVSQHRYQRLEDLHAQLTNWSSLLQKELVELINRDYADFVGLGKSVSGGSGKVGDMKLVVIGFRREVEGISSRLNGVIQEMDELLQKKRAIRQQESLGRSLISYAQGLQELEIALHIGTSPVTNSAEIEDTYPSLVSKLKSLTAHYHSVRRILNKLPKDHPYVVAQDSRLGKIRTELIGQLTSQQDRDTKIELLSCLSRIMNEVSFERAVR
ncbi:oligomeric golgi complex component, COG2-domain-containing protein [Lipomyces doorenjongii]